MRIRLTVFAPPILATAAVGSLLVGPAVVSTAAVPPAAAVAAGNRPAFVAYHG